MQTFLYQLTLHPHTDTQATHACSPAAQSDTSTYSFKTLGIQLNT